MKYCHISFRSSFIIICVALAYLTYTPNLQATPPLPIPVQIYNLQDNTVSTPLIASIYEGFQTQLHKLHHGSRAQSEMNRDL